MKHTQGPWRVYQANGFTGIDYVGGETAHGIKLRSIVARCHDDWLCAEHPGNALDNAHLIAAAPEMLEALRGLVAEIQNGGYVPRLEDSANSYQAGRAFGLAKVVIAKAGKGEE